MGNVPAPKPLVRFRVYVDPRKRKTCAFFWCTMWSDLRQARARMKVLSTSAAPQKGSETAAGACFSWTTTSYRPGNNGELMPEMGEIVLADRWSGGATISHECTHAAFRLGERYQEYPIEDEVDAEERFCLTVGYMSRQIIMRLCAFEKRRTKKQAAR